MKRKHVISKRNITRIRFAINWFHISARTAFTAANQHEAPVQRTWSFQAVSPAFLAGHLPGYCAPHSWPRNGSCWILDQKKRKETPTTHEPSTKKKHQKTSNNWRSKIKWCSSSIDAMRRKFSWDAIARSSSKTNKWASLSVDSQFWAVEYFLANITQRIWLGKQREIRQ